MAGSLNKVMLIGNVGKDPEVRTTQSGKEVASFPLATSDTWRDKTTGEKQERTEWHRITVFSPGLVEVIKNYVKLGTKVYVEGSLRTSKWTDSNNIERYTTDIVLQGYNAVLNLLSKKDDSTSNSGPQKGEQTSELSYHTVEDVPELDDEIPF